VYPQRLLQAMRGHQLLAVAKQHILFSHDHAATVRMDFRMKSVFIDELSVLKHAEQVVWDLQLVHVIVILIAVLAEFVIVDDDESPN
jgi:hypothetical protein